MYQLVSGCIIEPVSLDELKDNLRITHTALDTHLTNIISSARSKAENHMRRYLRVGESASAAYASYKLKLDKFPDTGKRLIKIIKSPVTEITHIKYYDLDNVQQTLDASYYDTDLVNEPARITESFGYSWPSTRQRLNAVEIQFKCGYGTRNNIPFDLRQGILMFASHLFLNPSDVVTGTQVNEVPESSVYIFNDYRISEI